MSQTKVRPVIDLSVAQHLSAALPMFPEYVAARFPIGIVNEFSMPKGLYSFIYHPPRHICDGRLHTPTLQAILEGGVCKTVAYDGSVRFGTSHEIDHIDKLNDSLNGLLEAYKYVLEKSTEHAENQIASGFTGGANDTALLRICIGMGLSFFIDKQHQVNFHQEVEFTNEEDTTMRSVVTDPKTALWIIKRHYAKQGLRLALFINKLDGVKYAFSGTSFS